MNVDVSLAVGGLRVHLTGNWTTDSSLSDVIPAIEGHVQTVTVEGMIIDKSNFESTTLGSLLPNDKSSNSLCIKISEKKPKTESTKDTDSLRMLLEEGVLPLNYDNFDLLSSAHTDHTGHDDADIETITINLKNNVSVDDVAVDQMTLEKSSLLLLERREDTPQLKYLTEADIQSLVVSTVKDALRLAVGKTAADKYTVHYEVSLFSFRPDIVVIHHQDVGIALVVEVKKPGKDVFTSQEVAGQVNTYGMGQLSSGIPAPFVILSSYDGMCITFPKRCLAACEQIMNKNIRGFSSPYEDPVASMEVQDLSKLEQVFSALSASEADAKQSSMKSDDENDDDKDEEDENNEYDETDDGESDEDYEPPCVVYSQVFKGKDIVPALIFVLRCGLDALVQRQPRRNPGHNESAEGICALADAKSLVWKDIPESLVFDYFKFPAVNTKKFYLWTSLGRGSVGRVFLACGMKGKVCAVKFFYIDEKEILKYPKAEREQARELAKQQRKGVAEREREMWRKAYEDKRVVVKELNNCWCCLMPYCDPAPEDDAQRAALLPKVSACLENFKAKGLRFKQHELQWRHVRMNQAGSVTLVDLGSLEQANPNDIDVGDQMAALF